MKKISILLVIVIYGLNLYSQDSLFLAIQKCEQKCSIRIMKHVQKEFGKQYVKQFPNILFIHEIYLKNLMLDNQEYLQKVYLEGDKSVIYNTIKENPTSSILTFGEMYDRCGEVMIYNDLFNVLAVGNSEIIYSIPNKRLQKENERLKYFLDLKADLIFQIVGDYGDSYYMLYNNKIEKIYPPLGF